MLAALRITTVHAQVAQLDCRKLYLNRTLRSERAEDDNIGALHSAVLLLRQWLRG